MPRPSREETLLKQLLKLSPVNRKALLKKASVIGKDAKKLKIRRKELIKQIRALEKEVGKLDKQLGIASGTGAGRGGFGRKRGPRDPEATRLARITRYKNSIPRIKAELDRAKGSRREKLLARLSKAEKTLKELS